MDGNNAKHAQAPQIVNYKVAFLQDYVTPVCRLLREHVC